MSSSSHNNSQIFAVDKHFHDLQTNDFIKKFSDINEIDDQTLDIVFALDVLEHVKNDHKFFVTIVKKMTSGGTLYLTVPAHSFLFSKHDINLKHFRRYSKLSLIKVLNHDSVNLKTCFYFFTSLFFLRCLTVIIEKFYYSNSNSITKTINSWKLSEKSLLTKSMTAILNCDFKLNQFLAKIGVPSTGLSICAVITKK